MADERDHDLGVRVAAGLALGDGRVEDGPRLDLHEVGDHQAEAAAAQAQHGVLLAQRLDGGQHRARLDERGIVLRGAAVAELGDLDEQLAVVGQELVERRVDEADDDRQAAHGLEDAPEVALLERLELAHRGVEAGHHGLLLRAQRLAGGDPVLGPRGLERDEDRVAHDLQPLALAEHVLGAAQADALRAVAAGQGGLFRLVGVGPDLEAADVVGPAQDLLQPGLVLEADLHGRQGAQVDLTGRAVEADRVALLEGDPVGRGGACLVVHDERRAAGHAGLADLARDDGRVGGGAAACGEDALAGGHAVEVVG